MQEEKLTPMLTFSGDRLVQSVSSVAWWQPGQLAFAPPNIQHASMCITICDVKTGECVAEDQTGMMLPGNQLYALFSAFDWTSLKPSIHVHRQL